MFRKKKKSKSSKEKLERVLREESANKDQRYQDVEKTEAERKFEEIKRQRVSHIYMFVNIYSLLLL